MLTSAVATDGASLKLPTSASACGHHQGWRAGVPCESGEESHLPSTALLSSKSRRSQADKGDVVIRYCNDACGSRSGWTRTISLSLGHQDPKRDAQAEIDDGMCMWNGDE